MKTLSFVLAVTLMTGLSGQAVTSTFGVSGLAATISDGDLNGYQSSFVVSGFAGPITDVNFSLNVSGGFNGDFYACISHGNATAILLNRTGVSNTNSVGYSDGGFAITLDDQASSDVHFYRSRSFLLNSGQLTGAWQPDARAIDPLSSDTTFSGASRNDMLSVFNGMDPNGTWTFFIADVAAGAEGQLNSYTLQVTAVPEPSLLALAILPLAWAAKRFLGR